MAFNLDLALVYACALVLAYWVATWLLPAFGRALVAAVLALARTLRMRPSDGQRAPRLPAHLPDLRVRSLF